MDDSVTASEVLWVLAATVVLTAAFASLTIHRYPRIR